MNSKDLRTIVRSHLIKAAPGIDVSYGKNSSSSQLYIVFILDQVSVIDGRISYDLEVDVIAPASESDAAEAIADSIQAELNHCVDITDTQGVYTYCNSRNTIDGSDPHTVRERMTFELYFYERK